MAIPGDRQFPRPYYTPPEIARLCGVSPPTVRRWLRLGLLEGDRLPGSRHVRVRPEALAQFFARTGR